MSSTSYHTSSHHTGGSFLPAVIFALFDYLSLVLAGLFAVHLRNWVMTYSTFHLSASYFFFWLPLVFMLFIFFGGLYGKRMLVYQMTERLFLACLGGTVFSVLLMFIAQVSGQVSRLYKGLCETVGMLMATPSQGRQVAVVPFTESTLRLAERLAPRCALAGIEIALVGSRGEVRDVRPVPPAG